MDWTETLPKTGPFAVRTGSQIWDAVKGVGLGLVLVAIGVGMTWMGGSWALEAVHVQSTWSNGTVVDVDPGYDGEVTTTNLIFNDYEMAVSYEHPAAGMVTFDMELLTFFTGPDESTPMVVHAMETDPASAVTNWQANSWPHTVVWCLMFLGIGLLMVGGGGLIVIGAGTEFTRVRRLAATGVIVAAEVVGASAVADDEGRKITLTVQLPGGAAFDLEYTEGADDPYFPDESHVAVLSASDESEVLLLEADGAPLAL